jgi:hypothetical protein
MEVFSMKSEKESKEKIIEFYYIKSQRYRSIYADGVFGGITPKGKLSMQFFFEGTQVPISVKHEILENGVLGNEIERKSNKGILREIECCLIVDVDTAKAMQKWLDEKIQQYEKFFTKKNEEENHEQL